MNWWLVPVAPAALAIAAYAARRLLVAGPRARRQDLTGKTIVVTGANSGLGRASATEFARWGAEVIVTSRDRARVEAAATAIMNDAGAAGRVRGHALDIADAPSVEAFATWLSEEVQRVDVLVNNAGIHFDLLSQWDEPLLSADGHEVHWRTNFLGTFHLTQRLLPLLERSAREGGDARVVNVISMLHEKGSEEAFFRPSSTKEGYNSWVAYGSSKLATLLATTRELHRRYGEAGVSAFALHPGSVYTSVASKGLAGNEALLRIRDALAPIERYMLKTPFEGAQTQIHCATSPELRGGGSGGGRYMRDLRVAESTSYAIGDEVASRLYDRSLGWLDSLAD